MEDVVKGLGIGILLVMILALGIGLLVGDAEAPPSAFDAEPGQEMRPIEERLAAWGVVALICVAALIAAARSDWWQMLG